MRWSLGFQLLDLGFLLFRQCYDLNPEEVVDLMETFLRCLGSPHRAGTGFSQDWTSNAFTLQQPPTKATVTNAE